MFLKPGPQHHPVNVNQYVNTIPQAGDSTTIPKFVLPSLTAPPPPTIEEAKQRWLETVHCDVFEPFDGWEAVLRRELMAL